MIHHLIRMTSIIITLTLLSTLLLAVFAGPVQASETRSGQSETWPVSGDEGEQVEDTALICLALVGGTALLAGTVWVGMLRRMPS